MENEIMSLQKNDNLQMMSIEDAKSWYQSFVDFSASIMKKDLDYGVIPGTPKPSLYKPGAEKLRFVYGLGVEMEVTDKYCDYDKAIVDYTYKAVVKSKTGQILAECEGSCNSLEAKFGYLWKTIDELPEGTDIAHLPTKVSGKKLKEPAFAVDRRETSGQYGKPAEYWQMWEDAINNNRAKIEKGKTKAGKEMDWWVLDEQVTVYRVTNPDVIGMKNTIMKMAQKRAFVGAILLATGASEFYTQDIEDMDLKGTGDVYSDTHITDAEVVSTTKNDEKINQAENFAMGAWMAKIEKCKTKKDLVKLYNDNAAFIDVNETLQKELRKAMDSLKK